MVTAAGASGSGKGKRFFTQASEAEVKVAAADVTGLTWSVLVGLAIRGVVVDAAFAPVDGENLLQTPVVHEVLFVDLHDFRGKPRLRIEAIGLA